MSPVPLFVGPLAFLVVGLLAIVLVLSIARLIFSLAWDILVIAAIVLGVLWLLGAVGGGPPF
jgi:predicted RND superfamily exporter protein